MSILSALKQEGSSIDELARLPQAMIMQMAQKKQLGAEMVAPILARKAEMADAVARTKALQQTGATAPTVMEQLMQKNAEAEQPPMTDGRDMGIAQLPVQEGMYDEQRMAGGGIVAFAEAGPVEDKNLPPRQPGESENAYMQRVQALYSAGSELFNPRNYNPLNKLGDLNELYQRNVGQPFAEGVKRFTNESPESQAARFNALKQQPTPNTPAPAAPSAPASALPPMPTNVKLDDKGRADAAKQGDKAPAKPAGIKSLQPTPTPNVEQAGPQQPSEIQMLLAQARADIEDSKTDREKAKKEAMYSRLVEAGLNIMGGQSSNFAQNIALASPVMRGYGEDVKNIRAEERDAKKQLAALGLKGYELNQAAKKAVAEENYMKQRGKSYEDQARAALISANRGDGTAELRSEMAKQTLALNTQKAADLALEKAGYGLLANSKKPEKIKQAAELKESIYKQYGVIPGGTAPPSFSGGSTFNYVPGKGLVPVQ